MVFKGKLLSRKSDQEQHDVILPFLKKIDGGYEVIDNTQFIYVTGLVNLRIDHQRRTLGMCDRIAITTNQGRLEIHIEDQATITATTEYLTVEGIGLNANRVGDRIMDGATIQVDAYDAGYPDLTGEFEITL